MQQIASSYYDDKEENRLHTNFIYSIRTEASRQIYLRCLKYFMKFLGVETFKELIDIKAKPQKIIESDIKEYLVYLERQKKISYNTKYLYLSAIRKFYYQFKWDLIVSYLGNDDDEDNHELEYEQEQQEQQEQQGQK